VKFRIAGTTRTAWAAVIVLGAWLVLALPVAAQEAYYWCYARHPAWSYLDHPPLMAWLIWLGTRGFGDGPVGIRAGSYLCTLAATWIGQRLLRRLGGDRSAECAFVWCTLGVPLLGTAHALTNPDPPLVCAFTATLYALWRARDGSRRWWLLAGVAAGASLLAKYTGALLFVGGVLVLLFDPQLRRQLRTPWPWLAVLIAALVFSPVVWWNAQRDWISFGYQTDGRWERGHLQLHWLLQFLGGQLLAFGPLLLLLPWALRWALPRLRADARLLWLCAFGLPLPAFMACNSLWIQVKINWLLPVFVPWLLLLLLWHQDSGVRTRWPWLLRAGRQWLRCIVALVVLAPLAALLPLEWGGGNLNGWREVGSATAAAARALADETGRNGHVFVLAPDYYQAAQLSRQITDLPVLAGSAFGQTSVMFDSWTEPSSHIGDDAVFVLSSPEHNRNRLEQVQRVFASMEPIGQASTVRVTRLGILVQEAWLYRCRAYRGPPAMAAK